MINNEEKELIIEALTQNDIEDIKIAMNDFDFSLIINVIQGNNYIPLRNLSDEFLFNEFKNRFRDSFLDGEIPSYVSEKLYKFLE